MNNGNKLSQEAKSSIFNGFAGIIPGLLFGGPVGAVISVVTGFIFAGKAERRGYKQSCDFYEQRVIEAGKRMTSIDEWDKENVFDLNGKILRIPLTKKIDCYYNLYDIRLEDKHDRYYIRMKRSEKYDVDFYIVTYEKINKYGVNTIKNKAKCTLLTVREFFSRYNDRFDEVERIQYNNIFDKRFNSNKLLCIDNEYFLIIEDSEYPEGKPL